MNRRDFLIIGAAMLGGAAAGRVMRATAWAQTASPGAQTPAMLMAVSRTLEINGKSAKVFGLVRNGGAPGITL